MGFDAGEFSGVGGPDDPFYDLTEDEQVWVPEPAPFEDFLEMGRARDLLPKVTNVSLSEFTHLAFRMPSEDGQSWENFSFKGRRHMTRIYDTPAKRVLLVCARQVEKSTLLGNKAIAYSCLVPGFKTLYVSPTSTQTKTFSTDRLKEPIETSPILKAFTTTMLSQNVFEKQFVNWSKITLRNAFLNADRTRGIPAWMLEVDEFQDVLADNIPVIEQCTSHAPEMWKKFCYAGTPKSLDNNIEYYRAQLSTQGEWAVPCDHCGSNAEGAAGRYWNILGEKNLGKHSLICEKCGKQIYPQHDEAQWVAMVKFDPKTTPFESYRIPQLMVPWKAWDEIMLDYLRYPRDKFYNEVLGLSYDSGMRPLNMAQVKECCNQRLSMHPAYLERLRRKLGDTPIFMGIDWGTGEHTYTVIVMGAYFGTNMFRIFYMHRCTGAELEPPVQMALIDELIDKWNPLIIGADYGGGFHSNDHVVRKVGPKKVAKFQYMARNKRKVEWDPKLLRYKVHRTEVMSDLFNAIKRVKLEFPRWEETKEPFAQDMCNIFAEYNNVLRMIQYDHSPDRPDDTFHAVLYCFLASMIRFPRPDIITPLREDQNRGPLFGGYNGPQYQG